MIAENAFETKRRRRDGAHFLKFSGKPCNCSPPMRYLQHGAFFNGIVFSLRPLNSFTSSSLLIKSTTASYPFENLIRKSLENPANRSN